MGKKLCNFFRSGSSSSSDSSADRSSIHTEDLSFTPVFSRRQCLDAIRGLSIPESLDSITARCAVIRGIRTNYDFATSDAVIEISSCYSEITRARLARMIMSNQVPDQINSDDHVPYCIWYPDIATEETYREVARKFPAMRYIVGRACAAAGYVNLYRELGLRPDVAIAEEARESGTEGGAEIYRMIMAPPVKFQIMDDIHCTIDPETQIPAFLNGDTLVRWMLDERYSLPHFVREEVISTCPDIEEDRRLAEEDVSLPDWRSESPHDEAMLLCTPLPRDLPTMKKDLLIQMAAYEGNIDRYARLMRPGYMTEIELFCAVRGIFHHTMFARWWADQLTCNPGRIETRDSHNARGHINEAINARRIMINDISGFTDETEDLPYMIWWPLRPTREALRILAERCPKMKHQIAITCVLCDYEHLYRELCVEPHHHIWLAATRSPNTFYMEDLEARAKELGFDVTETKSYDRWVSASDAWLREDMEPTTEFIYTPLCPGLMGDHAEYEDLWFGYQLTPTVIERYVWQKPELLKELEENGRVIQGWLE